MATIADTLLAIESRAERAFVQELRQLKQEILSLQGQLGPDERDHADALLLKLERLASDQVCAPLGTDGAPEFLLPTLSLTVFESPASTAYRVFFYSEDYGDLEDVVTVDTFEAGVQLMRDRLALNTHLVVTANWVRNEGDLTVATLAGMVLARIDTDKGSRTELSAEVQEACALLRAGDPSLVNDLFCQLLQAA